MDQCFFFNNILEKRCNSCFFTLPKIKIDTQNDGLENEVVCVES